MESVLYVLCLLSVTLQASSYTQQIVYFPGLGKPKTYNFKTDYNDSQVLRNFTDVVGKNSFILEALEDSGFYVLQVESGTNGTYIDDNRIYHAVPGFLCKYSADQYLVQNVPSNFGINRTAALPCTILGNPTPTFYWEKKVFNTFIKVVPGNRYYTSPLGHLFIEYLEFSDSGTYRCIANNGCGQRCTGDMRCTGEKVYGDELELKVENTDDKNLRHFLLNPVIDTCWTDDENGKCLNTFGSTTLFQFRQFTSLNRTTYLEALIDYSRNGRVARVMWREPSSGITNFKDNLDDRKGFKGACIGQINGFKDGNSKDYYYCVSKDNKNYDQSRIMYAIALRDLPTIQLPGGIKGKHMTRLMEFQAGKQFKLYFQLSSKQYSMNDVTDSWHCKWNGDLITKDWHSQCEYNTSISDIVTITINYAVSSDSGVYQVYADNEEGYAVGPPVMVVVVGAEAPNGKYVLTPTLIEEHTIDIQWKRPDCNCDTVFDYTVSWKNTVWSEALMKENTTQLTYRMTKLRPGVQYETKITTGQNSLVANTKLLTTKSILPECEVQPFFSVSTTNMTVYWKKYDIRKIHGTFKGYEVKVQSRKKPLNHIKAYMVQTNKIYVEHLTPYMMYSVYVRPCNEKGCVEHYQSYNIMTKEAIPKFPPAVYSMTASYWSINVSIMFPIQLPGELSIEVDIAEHDSNFLRERSVHNLTNASRPFITFKSEHFVLTNLHSNTLYYLRMRLTTKAGPGPFSEYFPQKTAWYIDMTPIYVGISVCVVLATIVAVVTIYIKRNYPGMAKTVFTAIRNMISPIYVRPTDNRPPWEKLGDNNDVNMNIIIEMADETDMVSKPVV